VRTLHTRYAASGAHLRQAVYPSAESFPRFSRDGRAWTFRTFRTLQSSGFTPTSNYTDALEAYRCRRPVFSTSAVFPPLSTFARIRQSHRWTPLIGGSRGFLATLPEERTKRLMETEAAFAFSKLANGDFTPISFLLISRSACADPPSRLFRAVALLILKVLLNRGSLFRFRYAVMNP